MTAYLAKSESMFENPEIERDDLPQAESVSWLGMDAKLVRRLLVGAAIGLFFATVGIFGLQTIFNVAFAEENINVNVGGLWFLLPVIALPLFIWPLISVPSISSGTA